MAKISANTPFTFQTLDKDGLALNMAQTWHQVRPGEMRANCGGCHAHSQAPLLFADHPTETVPGDAATLPAGASANAADLDYTGDIMPPPDSGVPLLTEDEKMLFARWVDLGCPINTGTGGADADYGWFSDENQPTLAVSSPGPNKNIAPLTEIRVGVADANSGIKSGSLSIRADFAINGAAPGTELVSQGSFVSPGIFVIPLQTPVTNLTVSHLSASVQDVEGNVTRADVRFHVGPAELKLRRLDSSQLSARRITLHVDDEFPNAIHSVMGTGNLALPLTQWQPVPVRSTVQQDDRYQIEVEVPEEFRSRFFLRVMRQ